MNQTSTTVHNKFKCKHRKTQVSHISYVHRILTLQHLTLTILIESLVNVWDMNYPVGTAIDHLRPCVPCTSFSMGNTHFLQYMSPCLDKNPENTKRPKRKEIWRVLALRNHACIKFIHRIILSTWSIEYLFRGQWVQHWVKHRVAKCHGYDEYIRIIFFFCWVGVKVWQNMNLQNQAFF